jgi:hypothetical protein
MSVGSMQCFKPPLLADSQARAYLQKPIGGDRQYCRMFPPHAREPAG